MPTLTSRDAADLFRRDPDGFLDVGAGEVAYRTVGTGPDVLFVHGWPVSGATYRALLPHLVDHVTCHVIDLPSAGSSRFDATTTLSVEQHMVSVKRVVDLLGLDDVALVGHDSGGLIARHAMVGDSRLRAMGLINTETPHPGWRFKSLIAARRLPALGPTLRWISGKPRLRRNGFVFGDAFADSSLIEGEFDEFFLRPLSESRELSEAAARLLRSFDMQRVADLPDVHRRLDVPVQLVWGDRDPYFPVQQAKDMVDTFPDAQLEVIEGAGLFAQEERPAEVAQALIPTLTGTR